MTSAIDTARAAAAAGFPDKELVTAVAVAIAESSLNETATHRNANGSIDYGLWQINSVHGYPELSNGQWKNPTVNAQLAHQVWLKQGWNAWAVHNPVNVAGFGRYQLARPIAVAAVAAAGKPGGAGSGIVGTPGDLGNALAPGAGALVGGLPGVQLAGDTVSALRWIQQPETWVRASKIIVGGALVIAGVVVAVKGSIAGPIATVVKAVK